MIITLAKKYIKSDDILTRIENNIEKFEQFKNLVYTWNRKINLTSYEEEDFYFHAIIENLIIFDEISLPENILDIGTGFGNPSISLAITFPEIKVYCSEINKKRLSFLIFVKNELDLNNLIIQNEVHRKKYRLITGKAFMNYQNFFDFLQKNEIKFSQLLLYFKDQANILSNKILVKKEYFYKNKKYIQMILY